MQHVIRSILHYATPVNTFFAPPSWRLPFGVGAADRALVNVTRSAGTGPAHPALPSPRPGSLRRLTRHLRPSSLPSSIMHARATYSLVFVVPVARITAGGREEDGLSLGSRPILASEGKECRREVEEGGEASWS
jgi:hypothetical protein